MWLRILTLTIFIHSSSPQIYDASKFDNDLFVINQNLKNEEVKMNRLMQNLIPLVNSTSLSFSDTPRFVDLVTALNNLEIVLQKQSTLNNYPEYENITTCTDVNMKITTIEFDIKLYYALYAKIASNLTELYQKNVFVAHYYGVNLYYIGVGSANQINCNSIIVTTNQIVVAYSGYAAVVARSIALEYNIMVQLLYFKQKYCKCDFGISTSVSTNVTRLEANLDFLESPLVTRQSKIKSLTATAQSKVTSATSITQISRISQNLATISSYLSGVVTINDYGEDPWPGISSCNNLLAHVGYVRFKYWKYVAIYQAVALNYSLAVNYQVTLNASVSVTSPSTSQLKSIQEVISAMINLHAELKEYLTQMSYAIWQISLVLVDVTYLTNTYCGCGGTTRPTTTFTTTKRSTLTTSTSKLLTKSTTKTVSLKTRTKKPVSTSSRSTVSETTSSGRLTSSQTTSSDRPTTSSRLTSKETTSSGRLTSSSSSQSLSTSQSSTKPITSSTSSTTSHISTTKSDHTSTKQTSSTFSETTEEPEETTEEENEETTEEETTEEEENTTEEETTEEEENTTEEETTSNSLTSSIIRTTTSPSTTSRSISSSLKTTSSFIPSTSSKISTSSSKISSTSQSSDKITSTTSSSRLFTTTKLPPFTSASFTQRTTSTSTQSPSTSSRSTSILSTSISTQSPSRSTSIPSTSLSTTVPSTSSKPSTTISISSTTSVPSTSSTKPTTIITTSISTTSLVPSTSSTKPSTTSSSTSISTTSFMLSTSSTKPSTTSTSTSISTTSSLPLTSSTKSSTTSTIITTISSTTRLQTSSTTRSTSTSKSLTTSSIKSTTTLPPLNNSECYVTQNFTISSGYFKTGCWMRSSLNFASAASICFTNGMTLFIIDNDTIYSAWKVWVNKLWPKGVFASWNMNGVRNSRNFWGLYTSPSTALYNGFTWKSVNFEGSGCLVIERDNTGNLFEAYAVNCESTTKTFFCEYIQG